MRLRLLGLALASLLPVACDGTSVALGTPLFDGSAPPPAGAQPPPPGPDHPGDGPTVVFAATKLFLGDTDRAGRPSPEAWAKFGFNIDDKIDACLGAACGRGSQHCRPNARQGSSSLFHNGDRGIDNSFGGNVVPILLGLDQKLGHHVNAAIASGGFSFLFAIDGLGSDSSYEPLAARFYRGVDLGHPPASDGSDAWPIAREALRDPSDVSTSVFAFPKSWVTDDTWVSGTGALTLWVPVGTQPLILAIRHATVAMTLSSDRSRATDGVIAGVLSIEDLVAEAARVGGGFDDALCSGTAILGIEEQLRQSCDLMIDGRDGTNDETCDAISIGLGFEAVRAKLGDPVAEPLPPNPCTGKPPGSD